MAFQLISENLKNINPKQNLKLINYLTSCTGHNGLAGGQSLDLLYENKKELPFGLYVTNSVQEEIGLRGAEMISHTIKPNLAIVTDVTHDTTTPMIDQKKEGAIKNGDGPVIAYAPAVQQKLLSLIHI